MKHCKIAKGRHLDPWNPFLWKILDPPLFTYGTFACIPSVNKQLKNDQLNAEKLMASRVDKEEKVD